MTDGPFTDDHTVTYVTVATPSARRWFDLDAVRTEQTVPNGGPLRGRAAQPEGMNSDAGSEWARGERLSLNPAGAPPLDWHDDTPNQPDTVKGTGTGMTSTVTLHIGDVFDRLADIPDGSVDLIVTSPPFLALRSYLPADHPDKHREIGSEATPADFLDTLLALTAEWRRVLAPHGSLCVELGDTYSGSGGAGGDYADTGNRHSQEEFAGSMAAARRYQGAIKMAKDGTNSRLQAGPGWPLAKSLTGIPTLYTWSLAYGRNLLTGAPSPAGQWRIRNLLVWARPNPPVGALGDKFRPACSYITVACTGAKRWFDLDAVRTEAQIQMGRAVNGNNIKGGDAQSFRFDQRVDSNPAGAPPLDWHTDGDDGPTGDRLWIMPTQPYKGAHYACVDAATEALTPHGWRRHDQLRDGDLIATCDSDGGAWRFAPAFRIFRYDYDGDLVAIDKRVTNQRLTPNHRVLYNTRKDLNPRIRHAATLTATCFLPVAAPMDEGGVGPGEKAAALAGWYCAEGSNGRWPVIHQSPSANPANVQAIRSLLDGLGADYRERIRVRESGDEIGFEVHGALAEWLRQFHKNLPFSAIFGWSTIDARALFDALIDGDGHRRLDGRMQFIQKAHGVAEAVQMLAVRLGYRTTLSQRLDGKWVVYISPGRWIDLRTGFNGLEAAVGREHYVGTVWCPSVTSGIWLARRNGQPFITGNTYPLELPRRLIEAMCPREVCRVCGKARERITGAANYVPDKAHRNGGRMFDATRSAEGVNQWEGTGQNKGLVRTAPTLGWSDCGHDNYRPGIVLDPFLGSGTTAVAAAQLGRDCIGIDLDDRNTDLVDRRIREKMHVVNVEALNHFDLRWQCDAPLPDQTDQIEGQTNLFDLMEPT